jgi:hypothetical protein
VYLHGFEADRATETITGEDRRSIEGKIKNYALYLDPKSPFSYRKRYGLSNCLVPFVTTKAARARNILSLIEELAPAVAHKFIVKVIPDFGATKPCADCRPSTRAACAMCKGTNRIAVPCPPPTAHMLTEDWMQSGGRTLNLMSDILLRGDDSGLSKESRAGKRAGARDQGEGSGAGGDLRRQRSEEDVEQEA